MTESAVFSSGLDVLAFGPHPDDVEIRCGGLLLKLVDLGRSVGVVDCTRGEMGTRGTIEQRAEEALRAKDILGISVRDNLGLPDGFITTGSDEKLAIVAALRKHRPRVVLAPYPRDLHPDHAAVGQLLEECSFLSGLRKIGDAPPHRPQVLFFYLCHHPFVPTFVVDVTQEYSRKLAAIRCYHSQLHQPGVDAPATDVGSPDYLEKLRANHRYFGSLIGVELGEPYFAHRPFQLDDPVAPYATPRSIDLSRSEDIRRSKPPEREPA